MVCGCYLGYVTLFRGSRLSISSVGHYPSTYVCHGFLSLTLNGSAAFLALLFSCSLFSPIYRLFYLSYLMNHFPVLSVIDTLFQLCSHHLTCAGTSWLLTLILWRHPPSVLTCYTLFFFWVQPHVTLLFLLLLVVLFLWFPLVTCLLALLHCKLSLQLALTLFLF